MSEFSQLIENIDPSQFDELFMPAYKRQRKFSSGAARRIQRAYRGYRQRASSRTSDLRSTIRSYRRSNPPQVSFARTKTVSFWRKTTIQYTLNNTSGFNGAGGNTNFNFQLGGVQSFINGVAQVRTTFSGFSDFQALFDYYMLKTVKMTVFFSKTNADSSSSVNYAMPMLLIANDFDDSAEVMTRDSMNERQGCRTVVFDANNTNGINHYVVPRAVDVVVQMDVNTGATSSINAGVAAYRWLDTANSNVFHNGIKVLYDNQGRSSNTDLGTVTFVFDMCIVCKGWR